MIPLDSTLLIVVLGAMVAGFVQGLSGFAFGMVALSFWVWVLEPRMVAALIVFGALTGQLLAAFSVRRAFHWKLLLPFLAGGLVGIPFGLAILHYLNIALFKAILGGLLLIWCSTMLLKNHLPALPWQSHLTNAIVGSLGGMLAAVGGIAGAIPTLWCMLCHFDKDTQRAVIQNFNLTILLVTMGSYLATGLVTRDMLPMFGVVAVAMLIPTLIGTRLYLGISEVTFRKIVLSLLSASGAALLISAGRSWV